MLLERTTLTEWFGDSEGAVMQQQDLRLILSGLYQ